MDVCIQDDIFYAEHKFFFCLQNFMFYWS